jgi:hypothetical protein
VVNVVLQFGKKPPNEVANETHFGLKGAQNRKKDGFQGTNKNNENRHRNGID